jgi:hypothetical protein
MSELSISFANIRIYNIVRWTNTNRPRYAPAVDKYEGQWGSKVAKVTRTQPLNSTSTLVIFRN